MNYREKILHLITDYFEIAPDRLTSEHFHKSYTLPDPNQLYQIESVNAFDIYEMQLPYQFFLMDYNISYSTMVFLNSHQQLFANLAAKKETLSHLHQHNFFEFFYILDGTLDFVIESTHQRYVPGDCGLINPYARHVEEHHKHYTALYLSFSTDFFLIYLQIFQPFRIRTQNFSLFSNGIEMETNKATIWIFIHYLLLIKCPKAMPKKFYIRLQKNYFLKILAIKIYSPVI